jgi:peptidoglycan L-alanyl-D-glutamate endopeptidase CwlK
VSGYVYGRKSLAVFGELHPTMQRVFMEVLRHRDHSLLDGVRTIAEQQHYVDTGASKTMNSRHLPRDPETGIRRDDGKGVAWAVDGVPYPFVGWKHPRVSQDLIYFGGFVVGVAKEMGIELRYGGDWNMNGLISDNGFMDLDHWELPLPPGIT